MSNCDHIIHKCRHDSINDKHLSPYRVDNFMGDFKENISSILITKTELQKIQIDYIHEIRDLKEKVKDLSGDLIKKFIDNNYGDRDFIKNVREKTIPQGYDWGIESIIRLETALNEIENLEKEWSKRDQIQFKYMRENMGYGNTTPGLAMVGPLKELKVANDKIEKALDICEKHLKDVPEINPNYHKVRELKRILEA